MSIDLIGQNIERENQLIKNLVDTYNEIEPLELNAGPLDVAKRNLLLSSMEPLVSQLQIINHAIPDLVNHISFYKDLGNNGNEKSGMINVLYNDSSKKELNLAIKKNDEKKFLENLSLQDSLSKKMNAAHPTTQAFDELKFFISQSNRFCGKFSNKLILKGYFNSIKIDLRRITSPFLINTYIAMMFFSIILSFVFSLILGAIFIFVGLGFTLSLLLILLIPIVCFFGFYIYPSSRKKSLDKEINQELPFVTIYIAAIATSGIEPSKIFDILVSSKDYPFIQREMKKLTNLVNFYGYDLVTALKSISKNGPSERLGQLLDGIATTITSGGELTQFLSKHSETLLFDYRLEREKYTQIAETFMNIYISVVIAAPMIMMMLFILMSMTQLGGTSFGPGAIGGLTTLVITLLNLGFLVFLNMKQPKF